MARVRICSGMSNQIAFTITAATVAAVALITVTVDTVSITSPIHGITGAMLASMIAAAWKATK